MDHEERNVWQRVAAEPRPIREPEAVKALLREAAETEAIYRSLTAGLPGGSKLLHEQQGTVACLAGILAMSGGGITKLWFPGIRQPREKLLKLAYPRVLTALREYTARSGDPRFGAAFQLLARREEGHCLQILTLLGEKTGG